MLKISYLACPFSHSDPEIKKMRHLLVNKVAYEFHKRGKFVYSPLTHNLPLIEISGKSNNRNDWPDFAKAWTDFGKEMLSRCNELIVLKIPGWEQSEGVAEEIAYAKELNLPIEMIEPQNYFNLKLVVENN